MTILEAMEDPALFGRWFQGESWAAWRTILAALFALPPQDGDLERFRELTGRDHWPETPSSEAWIAAGRRGGKSRIAALIVTYLATFRDYSASLAPGERGIAMCLAADRRQAQVVLRYARAFFSEVPMLAALVERETAESIDLKNGISIEVHTCSYRTVRGRCVISSICDELAHWRDDSSANPDAEVIAALKPSMATIRNPLLLGISSPYARRGVLWDAYRKHYGRDSEVLVVQAPTRALNPTVPAEVIRRAEEEDPEAARAEYGAEFRRDVVSFLSREAVEAVVEPGRLELPPVKGEKYLAFCDPSGGSADSMTLAIAHKSEDKTAVLDLVREVRPPFSPEAVVAEFAEVLRSYRCSEVVGDRYGAEWVSERFQREGITYTASPKVKSDLYRELLPAINSKRVELLDLPRLIGQLCGLERRTSRGGRDSIDHAPGGHDDLANAAAGALYLAAERKRRPSWEDLYGPDEAGVAGL